MPLRLLPWSPEYGSALQADPDSYDEPDATAAETFEGEWRARRPSGDPPAAVQIVDGVRRVEAHALDDLPDGETAFGLFGSYAVGAVRCEGDRSWVLDGEGDGEGLRVLAQLPPGRRRAARSRDRRGIGAAALPRLDAAHRAHSQRPRRRAQPADARRGGAARRDALG